MRELNALISTTNKMYEIDGISEDGKLVGRIVNPVYGVARKNAKVVEIKVESVRKVHEVEGKSNWNKTPEEMKAMLLEAIK